MDDINKQRKEQNKRDENRKWKCDAYRKITCMDVTQGSDSGRCLLGVDLYPDAGYASSVRHSFVLAPYTN